MPSKSFRFVSVICIVLAMVLLFESAPMGNIAYADKTVDEMKDELGDLKDEAAQLENKIAQLRKDKEKKQELVDSLQDRANNTQAQIDVCNRQMAKIEENILAINQRIDALEADMKASKELFKKRLRATYMSGGGMSASSIFMLLESDDFADLLARSEFTKTISQKDKALMDEISAKIAKVQEEKTLAEAEKQAQNEVKAELDALRSRLNSQLYEAEEAVRNIDSDTADATRDLNDIEAEIERFEREIEAALDNAGENENLDFGSVSFQWPCPGFNTITSPFGYRYHPITGQWKLHGGTDIAGYGISNTPAVAAAAGKVIVATYNGSYGYYVMVYHGTAANGSEYATLYAHLWSYDVSVGDYVEAGDTLGKIGSTGSSTAPHLHFEVRKDGERVEPMNYF